MPGVHGARYVDVDGNEADAAFGDLSGEMDVISDR